MITAKKQRAKRRGRKPGDGVLQYIDPQSSGLEKAIKLAYGRTHGDRISEMVRWCRFVRSMDRDLIEREKALGTKLIEDAKIFVNFNQLSEDELASGRKFKVIGTPPHSKRISMDAIRYLKKKREVESRTRDIFEGFRQQMINALLDFKPEWFQKMADAIKTEKAASGQDAYPLHAALLSIAGAPRIRRTDLIYPENSTGVPVNLKPIYTIGEVCGILEKQRKRPATQTDADWQRTVLRACNQIGFPYLPSKPGPRPKKS